MTVDELKAAALRLAPQARAQLARELLNSQPGRQMVTKEDWVKPDSPW